MPLGAACARFSHGYLWIGVTLLIRLELMMKHLPQLFPPPKAKFFSTLFTDADAIGKKYEDIIVGPNISPPIVMDGKAHISTLTAQPFVEKMLPMYVGIPTRGSKCCNC